MSDLAAALAAGDTDVLGVDDLLAFVATRRWFGAKSRAVVHAQLVDLVPLPGDGPPLAIGLVEVRYQPGTHDVYQLLLGVRPIGGDPATRIAADDSYEIFEALEDMTGWERILTLIRQDVVLETEGGSHLRFADAGTGIPSTTAEPRPLGADQSNSAAVIGDELFLKTYRRLEPGVNPELEVLRFLSEREFDNAPELVGWYEREGEPLEATLGILLRYIPETHDGFTLTLDALGSDPASMLPRLRRLGEVTGIMHAILASENVDPHFAPETPGAQSIDLLRASIDEQVTELFSPLGEHPELGDLANRLEEIRDRLRGMEPAGDLGKRIRQHGDFHLGQALWNGEDWVLIDFEGEPARPVAERRRKHLPLRDVAGMMRSISYATWVARLDRGTAVPEGWEDAARREFLEGHQQVVEPLGILPALRETSAALLDLFELEKAIYELRYELDHRPDWARIPAAGIVALLERDGS
jgi:trehalose synthase-fused probable maltokinase